MCVEAEQNRPKDHPVEHPLRVFNCHYGVKVMIHCLLHLLSLIMSESGISCKIQARIDLLLSNILYAKSRACLMAKSALESGAWLCHSPSLVSLLPERLGTMLRHWSAYG